MSPAPLGWTRRDDRGVLGMLARWWGNRRTRAIRRGLAKRRSPGQPKGPDRGRRY